jgi:dTDP-4-dehydrorhamnose reductase
MRLLVTGAAGMLGQDVIADARRRGHDVVGRARAELDVVDAAAVEAAMHDVHPDAIINCAAYTNVDGAEEDERTALDVNGDGAGNVARAANQIGAQVVHVSTDYVFDGTATSPYPEDAPVAPLGAYGRTKLAGERQVAAAGHQHAIARTSWLFGVGGPNFVATMLRLASERDELAVVTDQVGLPTWTGHLATALVDLAESRAGGIHHVPGGGEEVSWHGFAVEIFRQAGVDCVVSETTSAEFRRPAPRPAYSTLGVTRTDTPRLPDWRDGLAGYLAARNRTEVAA